MKAIYEYLDYRKFLSDYFTEQRNRYSFFSYRYVEQKIGLDASNIAKIVNGKRHITDQNLAVFIQFLKLDSVQGEYFSILVLFSRSRAESKRRLYFEQLMGFNGVTATKISVDRYEFYQRWYYSAVLALLYYFPVKKGDWEQIALQLQPTISVTQARESVELLQRLGFIKVQNNGVFSHTETIITSGEQWRSVALETFQRQTLELALHAMESVAIEERYISTLTVTLSNESYQRVKALTAEYRKAVLKAVSECENSDRVYQVNMQIFPLSKGNRDE